MSYCRSGHLESVCVMVSQLVHLLHLLLALLETPEVVLDEESCIELTHGDVIISCGNQKPPNDEGKQTGWVVVVKHTCRETQQQYSIWIEHANTVR